MIYIYDILLNFCDNDNIYDFYEWSNNDDIENMKKIKLVHISSSVYDDILNYNFIINKDFLLKIYNTCELYGKKNSTVSYACLFSDGDRVLAVEFNKDGLSIYKSKLLLDEESEISVLASNLEIYDLKYNKKEKVLDNNFLTRKEVLIKRYLTKEIEDSYKFKKYDKLKYLYQEYFDKDNNSYKSMKEELIDSLISIDSKHKEICNLLKISNKKKQV